MVITGKEKLNIKIINNWKEAFSFYIQECRGSKIRTEKSYEWGSFHCWNPLWEL